ncbi:hypothetical protein FRC12_005037 [Ceratobasidium sp. 428]|nr:hypothetical protein FRC12_005037 [Ceratobasidium sp. 428]
MESMRDVPQIGALQINHGLIFADRVIGFLGNFLEGDDQKGASKDMAEPLMNILVETDIISLIAQAFIFPVSDELENLPQQEKGTPSINDSWT